MSADGEVELASPRDCLDGMSEVLGRLRADFWLHIRWEPLDDDTIGRFHGPTRTVTVNCDAPFEDQLWQLVQVWQYLAIGPSATPDAHISPALHLVPYAM